MPELPDVEAIRRYLLAQGIKGRRFMGVILHWPKAVKCPSPEEFTRLLVGRSVSDVDRRGKYLLFKLDQGFLILHLRMTGSLVVISQSQPPHHLTRAEFTLDGGLRLDFVDGRKLGMIWLVEDPASILAGLGPEPLDASFTAGVLANLLKGRKTPIKPLLLEQEVIAGIGNIYADEVLFDAAIHPSRPANTLTTQEMNTLHTSIRQRLQEATDRLCGILPIEGPPTESEKGSNALRMPRSEGERCLRCGHPIQRQVIRGRSAYFCARCQE